MSSVQDLLADLEGLSDDQDEEEYNDDVETEPGPSKRRKLDNDDGEGTNTAADEDIDAEDGKNSSAQDDFIQLPQLSPTEPTSAQKRLIDEQNKAEELLAASIKAASRVHTVAKLLQSQKMKRLLQVKDSKLSSKRNYVSI